MDTRDQRIADLESQLAARDATIQALTAQVDALTKTVAVLMAKLNANSRNSSLPPSSDGPGARGQQSSDKTKGKRGGQCGHAGHKREMVPPEQVNHFVELYPPSCENCWAALPQVFDAGATRFQVTEVPPIRPETTEYRCHSVRCTCGYTTHAKDDAVPTSQFGPRLMSLVGLLTGVYHLSRRRAVTLLHDVLGVKISLGAVSNIEARVAAAVSPAVDEAWTKIAAADVKHTDATSWLQNGKLRSLWTLATTFATGFRIFLNGSAASVKPMFGDCTGTLVSDRATVFSLWQMARRQICWAHLLRKFVSFSERDAPAKKFGDELLEYARLIFRYWHDFRDGRIDRAKLHALMAPVRAPFEACLTRASLANLADVSGSCADMLAHGPALWTFVDVDGVEPTNNHAERELRAFVLWRKRSFGTQSDRGNRFAERLMTVAHTARKQHTNVLTFLTDCCTARLNDTASPSLFSAVPA